MSLIKFLRRPRQPIPALLFDEEVDDEGLARGGYVFTADPDAPPLALAEPITEYEDDVRLSGPPYRLAPGQAYLIGGPGQPDFEVVMVEPGGPEGGEEPKARRCMYRTIGWRHPAGIPVTPVAVAFVEDWACWTPDDPSPAAGDQES